LRAMRPVEVEAASAEEEASLPLGALAGAAALGLAATMSGQEEPATGDEPTTEELLAELAELERAASVVEAEPAHAAITLSHDWWAQAAEDTGEEPLTDLPDPFLSARARSAEKEKARAIASEKSSTQPQIGSVRKTQTNPLAQTGQVASEVAAPSPEVEALLARIAADQTDYAARLDLARTYWATGDRDNAYSQYLELATAGQYSQEVMSDLETIVEIYDRPDWHRMLGDVYMKAGKLPQALTHYRQALNEL
jgi:tetratricopeptide (TPR) repeat protein